MDSNLANTLFDIVEEAPFSSLPKILNGLTELASVRKSSKILSTHLQYDIFGIQDARTLVLTAALYFEHIALRHADREAHGRPTKRLSAEIKALRAAGVINEQLKDNMTAVVRLRNEFAHNLFYDIANWDPLSAPFFTNRRPRLPNARHLRAAKNIVLVKVLLVEIYEGLHSALPWLAFEDVPRAFRRRSNNSLNPDLDWFGGLVRGRSAAADAAIRQAERFHLETSSSRPD